MDEPPDPKGPFSSFSSIQSVIITGYIDTPRSDQGLISYSTDLYYHFSCRYPLEYLINNTQIVACVLFIVQKITHVTQKWYLYDLYYSELWISKLSFSFPCSSSVSVATSDNNGTFIDTLKMSVFNVRRSLDLVALCRYWRVFDSLFTFSRTPTIITSCQYLQLDLSYVPESMWRSRLLTWRESK